ncbi:asparagine synthase (glutamine-hydrolyzing) [Mucilaginibacter sp.]|uniref:asparagine synthase (glutamine-hydrolyzing) n=1 Tax=Mucilaginibacter sp. TaxID=1882438 RepID=UPI0026353280|nr:asparagine synthase (glutamine-hydrolyzing) [Mucilaginibacter sp.]MDB4923346.1 hypothetical protein [Mucilaginibacter sp.]
MCGIYGSTANYTDNEVRAKLARAQFRGPDYSCFERVDSVILGHNRLAILDLDHRSDQPFTYEYLKLVFNGEIYNYKQLRCKLGTLGYIFTTDSDTEVIAAAYLEYGENCVDYFNGMFSFVIYDRKKQKFFGARDRLGKKPFYYAYNGITFEFASQPAQISLGRNTNLDERSISEYFIWGYIPEPRSAWKEIKKLKAGHIFSFYLNTCEFTTTKYWDLDLNIGQYDGTYLTAKQELKQLLANSVKIRLHADVNLGVFLSGGIDSSLVAALATENINRVKTFCIKFNEKGFDESVFAEKIARHLQTDHHVIECCAKEGLDLIENFGEYFDEPFSDSSAIPTLLLSKYTKKHVTVALSGDGGDESFMGYTRYRWIKTVHYLFKYPIVLRRALSSLIALLPGYRNQLIAMGICTEKIEFLYALMLGGLEYSWLKQPERGMDVPFMNIWAGKNLSILQKMSAFDVKTYLNGDINTKVDRASMAFAIEARAPLMDHRVVTFAQQLPDCYKYNNGVQKRILKDILYQYVPKHFFERPKSGFTMPLESWFRNELKDYVLDNLSVSQLKNIPGIDVAKTSIMIQQHMEGKWNRFPQIWKLLVFSQWLKNQKFNQAQVYQTA